MQLDCYIAMTYTQIGLLWPFNVNKNYLSIFTLKILGGHPTMDL